MTGDQPFRCGRVAVLGRTNAGKSTLLNRLVGRKVAIVAAAPQTTRRLIVGIRNEDAAQIVFVDTPGLHVPKHALNRRMIEQALGALEGVEAAVLLLDASARFGRGEEHALSRVGEASVPFVIGLNKVDRVRPKETLLPVIERFSGETPARAVVPLSALKGTGIDGLLAELRELLPPSPPLYPRDLTSEQTERFYVSELIREKVIEATRQELPHATAVFVEELQETTTRAGEPLLVVKAALAVEKPNQKGIVIGKEGSLLKRIGTAARRDIERQLGRRCHLETFVKVLPRWRDDRRVLAEVFAEHRLIPQFGPAAGCDEAADGGTAPPLP